MGSVWIAHCRSIHFDLAARPRHHWRVRCHALFAVVDTSVKMQSMVQWTRLDHIQPDENWWAAIDWSGSKESIVFHSECMWTNKTNIISFASLLPTTKIHLYSFALNNWSEALEAAGGMSDRLPFVQPREYWKVCPLQFERRNICSNTSAAINFISHYGGAK